MGVGAVDELDAEAVERGQHVVDAIGALDFIGQIAADFFVGEIALGFGLGDKFLQMRDRYAATSFGSSRTSCAAGLRWRMDRRGPCRP